MKKNKSQIATKKKSKIRLLNYKNILSIVLCITFGVIGSGILITYNALESVNYQALDEPTQLTDDTSSDNSLYTTSAEDANMSLSSGKLLDDPQVLNIMLFGADKTEGNEDYGRSDTMIMLSIDNINQRLKLTTFMRDLYVDIPGHNFHKLNSSYSWGGPSLTIQTIESNFGINIDRYAIVDFDSFENIIDVLGGIDIELTQEEIDYINWQMYKNHQTDTQTELVAQPGIVHLTGEEALWYSRNRGDDEAGFSGDDFDRTERQRKLISTLVDDMKEASLTQIVEIIGEIGPMITTNLKKDEITFLVTNALTYLNYDLVEFSVPSSDCWEYYITQDSEELDVLKVTDWTKQIFELSHFVYEDKLLKYNPEYQIYLEDEKIDVE